MNGITFNSKHSYNDFHLILNSRTITTPQKKKIKLDIPGMNSVYDFSTIASNGELIFTQRAIECVFTLLANSKSELQAQASRVAEWLQDAPQSQLVFDNISYFYFMAEVEGNIEINEEHNIAEITVQFIAEPFKTSFDDVGNVIWDTFNFNEDVMLYYGYDVVTTQTVNIYNTGRLIMPTINCNAVMSVVFMGKTYPLVIGDNFPYGLKLLNGDNTLVINGTGHVSVLFKKVSI